MTKNLSQVKILQLQSKNKSTLKCIEIFACLETPEQILLK